MVDKISNEDSKLYKIAINFVNSLFNINNTQIINSKENTCSKNTNIKNKSIKHKTNEYNQKINQNQKNINQNISKDNVNKINNNLTCQTTGKKKIKLNLNNGNSNNKVLFTEKSTKSTISNYLAKSTRHIEKKEIE